MYIALPQFHIDAFVNGPFSGNPAAVLPLRQPLSAERMQSIAASNNLSETAFLSPCETLQAHFELRWYTPTHEVDLCGHATLASGWLLLSHLGWPQESVRFTTRSGVLEARRDGGRIWIDLPARDSAPQPPPPALSEGLGVEPEDCYAGANWIAVYAREAQVRDLRPNFRQLAELHPLGVIATAPGDRGGFVSRYFAPSYGIDEDPVTGSAHCDLAPYWCARLGQTELSARQLSARGGDLLLRWDAEAERVHLGGRCSLYLEGQIKLPSTAAG